MLNIRQTYLHLFQDRVPPIPFFRKNRKVHVELSTTIAYVSYFVAADSIVLKLLRELEVKWKKREQILLREMELDISENLAADEEDADYFFDSVCF